MACVEKGIFDPVFIVDNARIHHYRGLAENREIAEMNFRYLPPYLPFLNPIEKCFSVWKNLVIRGRANLESKLRALIHEKFNEVTPEKCEAFYRNMLSYIIRSQNREIILE